MDYNLAGIKPPTEAQSRYIVEVYTKDDKSPFMEEFNKRSSEFKIPSEMINPKMRSWLDNALIKIPFKNLFSGQNPIQEIETYNELVTIDCKDMEWGVIQKANSIIIGVTPELFEIDPELQKRLCCIHSTNDTRRFCSICEGEGVLNNEKIPSETKLRLLSYNKIIQDSRKLNQFIIEEVNKIKTEVISSIWNSFESHERFNINGQIERLYGVKKPKQGII